ncbi:hypothetical protein GUJ93_ZPchr0007g5340 [Zizania palustris]|uniref:Uncharacterized protein n=1 Tax=Zizania palustris TaxID=103762 RepID=A0A8J5T3I0_ZIZPA|nr:hypothetical protein GUJ93_ZPchr0007g5340 [Zizania palustris]
MTEQQQQQQLEPGADGLFELELGRRSEETGETEEMSLALDRPKRSAPADLSTSKPHAAGKCHLVSLATHPSGSFTRSVFAAATVQWLRAREE